MGLFQELIQKAIDTAKEFEEINSDQLQDKMTAVTNLLHKPNNPGVYTMNNFRDDVLKGGIDANAIRGEYNEEVQRRASLNKPGDFCEEVCIPEDSKCQECLKLQKEFAKTLRKSERLQEFMDLSPEEVKKRNADKKIEFCPSCKAKFQTDETVCPYCGVPYAEAFLDFEVPLSEDERREKMLELAKEAVGYKREQLKYVFDNLDREEGDDWFHIFVRMPDVKEKTISYYDMSGEQIEESAQRYGVTIPEFLYKLGTGKAKNVVQLDEQRSQLSQIDLRKQPIKTNTAPNSSRQTSPFLKQMEKAADSRGHGER